MNDNSNGNGPVGAKANSRALPLAALAASVLAGFAAVYVTLGPRDNAALPQAAGTVNAQSAPPAGGDRLNAGRMAAFVFKKEPEPLAPIVFKDAQGREHGLEAWRGRVVLLNLWATWCAPCRKEMPGLDRLQQAMGSRDFEVLALALDRAGPEAAGKFLASVGVRHLALYIDTTTRAGSGLKAIGMPTTILIDRQGREIGRLSGEAEWDSEDAKRLIRAALR